MRPGHFFSLRNNADLREQFTEFRYNRLVVDGEPPIYVLLGAESIEFCISIPGRPDHATMLELFYSDYQDEEGKLAGQLLDIPKLTKFVIEVENDPTASNLSWNIQENLSNSSYCEVFSQKSGTRTTTGIGDKFVDVLVEPLLYEIGFWDRRSNGFSPETLMSSRASSDQKSRLALSVVNIFLDFLYDLKHSDEFTYSIHYNKLRHVARSNFVFRTIIQICEYAYWNSLVDLPKKKELFADWVGTQKIVSVKRLIKTLTSSEGVSVFANSAWLGDDLEKVVFTVVNELTGDESQRIESKFWISFTEWAVNRYAYFKTVRALVPKSFLNFLILISPLFFILLTIHYNLNIEESNSHVSRIQLLGLGFGVVGIIIGVLFLSIISGKKEFFRSRNKRLGSMIILVSPKVILAGSLGWLALEMSEIRQFFDGWEHLTGISVGILCVVLGTPLLYLYREVRNEAPDLSTRRIFVRVVFAEVVLLLILFLIGILAFLIILSMEAFNIKPSELTKYMSAKEFSIIKEALLATPFIYFSVIFLQTLFKGKRFTGM